jgi:tetratricopeptide (TPR) repeat protein
MKWLETPDDESERLLREGLDQASKRLGDEITHRRVWARIADALERPRARVSGRLVFASAAAVFLVAAGVVGFPKLAHFIGSRGTSAGLAAKSTVNSALPSNPARKASGSSEAAATPVDQTALLESERVPGHVVRTRAGEHARVALGGGAEAALAENSALTWDNQHRPSIEDGSAMLTVPHQPPGWRFSVTAGPYVVTVVGTRFEVHIAANTVAVEVNEGVVEVWRGSRSTRLVAGDSWNGPLYPHEALPAEASPAEKPQSLAPPHPRAAATTNRGLQAAEAALQMGDTSKAIEILTRTAAGTGPAAQNASYELGRIARYNLNRPRQAITLWEKYRTRFPSGLLRTEADLSIVDTLSSVGDMHAALAEADAFLARHPASERRFEVQRLAERLRAAESAAGQR